MLERIFSWLKNYLDYKSIPKTAENEKSLGGLYDSVPIVILAQLIAFFTSLFSYLVSSYFAPSSVMTFPIVFVTLLKLSIIALVLLYVSFAIFFLLAKAVGGKGSFSSQTYVLSIFLLCNNFYLIIFAILSHVPSISLILSLVTFVIGLYWVYSLFQTVRTIQQLSLIRSLAVVVVSWIIYFFLSYSSQFLIFSH